MIADREPDPSDACDEEWAFVAPELTPRPEGAGQREHSLREVSNGLRDVGYVGHVVKTGAPWRRMPNDRPPWSCVYRRARRWRASGCSEALVDDLRSLSRLSDGRNTELGAAVMDSRTPRSTPESGARAGGDGAKRKTGSEPPG